MNEIHVRKNIRLGGYDYNQNGVYFVTMCVLDRLEILGTITIGEGILDIPFITISKDGEIVDKCISNINSIRTNISIDKYVIMPNHVHMIVMLNGLENGMSRTPSPTNAAIPALVSTLKRFVNKEIGRSIWQRSYHDRIIRNDKEYLEIWKYIDENPIKWVDDEYNNKLFPSNVGQ